MFSLRLHYSYTGFIPTGLCDYTRCIVLLLKGSWNRFALFTVVEVVLLWFLCLTQVFPFYFGYITHGCVVCWKQTQTLCHSCQIYYHRTHICIYLWCFVCISIDLWSCVWGLCDSCLHACTNCGLLYQQTQMSSAIRNSIMYIQDIVKSPICSIAVIMYNFLLI